MNKNKVNQLATAIALTTLVSACTSEKVVEPAEAPAIAKYKMAKQSLIKASNDGAEALTQNAGQLSATLLIAQSLTGVNLLSEFDLDVDANELDALLTQMLDQDKAQLSADGTTVTLPLKQSVCADEDNQVDQECWTVMQPLTLSFTNSNSDSGSIALNYNGITPVSLSYSPTAMVFSSDLAKVKQALESLATTTQDEDVSAIIPEKMSGQVSLSLETPTGGGASAQLKIEQAIEVGDSEQSLKIAATDNAFSLTNANSKVSFSAAIGAISGAWQLPEELGLVAANSPGIDVDVMMDFATGVIDITDTGTKGSSSFAFDGESLFNINIKPFSAKVDVSNEYFTIISEFDSQLAFADYHDQESQSDDGMQTTVVETKTNIELAISAPAQTTINTNNDDEPYIQEGSASISVSTQDVEQCTFTIDHSNDTASEPSCEAVTAEKETDTIELKQGDTLDF